MVTAELVRRCGEPKGELVAFTRASRFARRVAWNDVNRADHFILQQRLPDGRTMIDLFVASRPDLSENERRTVLGWRNVVETIIEVRSHQDDTVEGVGVIDELQYRIHSTKPATGQVGQSTQCRGQGLRETAGRGLDLYAGDVTARRPQVGHDSR